MQASHLPVRDDFISQVVAGDVPRALALWPDHQALTLSTLIRHSYAPDLVDVVAVNIL